MILRSLLGGLRSLSIPREAIGAVVGASITAFATLSIAIVNLLNGFNEQLNRPFQIQDSLSKTQLTADYYRQTALSTYLSTAGNVLIQKGSDRTPEELATLRAMSHAVLQDLNADRKRYVIMLLDDAQVLQRAPELPSTANSGFLAHANLIGANLAGMDLSQADLREADLRGSSFRQAILHKADLSDANLTGADLRSADLSETNLQGTQLTNACYNSRTILDVNFDPDLAAMKKVSETEVCTPVVPSQTTPTISRVEAIAARRIRLS